MTWLRAKWPEGFVFGLNKTRVTLSITQLQQTASYRYWLMQMTQDASPCLQSESWCRLRYCRPTGGKQICCKTKEISNRCTTNFTVWILYICLIYSAQKIFKVNEVRLGELPLHIMFLYLQHHFQGDFHYQKFFVSKQHRQMYKIRLHFFKVPNK